MRCSYDDALGIHIGLIQFFRDGGSATSTELARRYDISQTTARRYLDRIDVGFLPLERKGRKWRKATLQVKEANR